MDPLASPVSTQRRGGSSRPAPCACRRSSMPMKTSIRGMDDKVYEQAVNVATLPGIVKASYVMPDAHWGYGFPIGGVAAFDRGRRAASCRPAASASTSPAACARC